MILSFGAEGSNIDLWDDEAQLVPEVKILFKMILGDKAKTFKDKTKRKLNSPSLKLRLL